MTRTCEKCGKQLEWVGSGPVWMNEYQWDAIKAGDWFVKCETPNHPNGNCYFIDMGDGTIYRKTGKPDAE
jgi:hypothetical protein